MLDISLCNGNHNNKQCKNCERYIKHYNLKGEYYSLIFVECNNKPCEYFIKKENKKYVL